MFSTRLSSVLQVVPGAIIGDGDHKRASFIVLGLAPWYGTIFPFLEQIARTCCKDFLRMSRGKKWRPKFPKSFILLAHNSTPLWLLELCVSIFAVSCSSLSGDSAEFRYVPLYIADQFEFRCSFYKNCTLLQSKFHIWRRLTAFPKHIKNN